MKSISVAAGFCACAILTTGSSAHAQSQDQRWQAIFNTETRYFWSQSNGGVNQRVQQVYAPVGLQVSGKPSDDWKIDTIVRSGYIWSQTQRPTTYGRYDGWTDTTVGGTATYLGLNGVQPFASINVNMPTGQSVVRNNQSVARNLDSDVVDTPTFGEGWNTGLTLGTTIALSQQLMVTVSGGYTYRAIYQREGLNVVTLERINRFDPADTFVANLEAVYRTGPWTLSASGSYGTENITRLDSLEFYKSGDRYSFAASAGYMWNQNWSSRLSANFTHMAKNKIIDSTISEVNVIPESFNGNSNVTRVTLDTTYANGPFAVTPIVGWLYRDHNAYDGTNVRFLPAKTKWWFGASAEYAVKENITITGRLEHMWLRENDKPDFGAFGIITPGSGTIATDTTAWLASLAGVFRF